MSWVFHKWTNTLVKETIVWNNVDEVIVEYDLQSIHLFLIYQTAVSFLEFLNFFLIN